MLKYVIAFTLLAAASAGSANAQEAKQDFTLVNKTGYDISELYVSPSHSDSWEEDLLADEDDNFGDGESKSIHFKSKVKTWLVQKDEVMAFAQARAADGGHGAVLVLLRSSDPHSASPGARQEAPAARKVRPAQP